MVTYIATERPRVLFINQKFVRNVSIISRRYSRDDPIYYINLYVHPLVHTGNNVSIDIYFYEFQANRYHRTYVELHAKMCDFIETSTLFGDTLKKALASQFDQKKCPFPPGPRLFANLTIPVKSIPDSFPYRQGRLYCNTSLTNNGATTRLADASIDLEVKVTTGNKFINKN
ncbi:hypothetical protein PYW07_004931 [Mythimna separata]|uniref:Uncharacterized protein n=1 Tax=Mythimna separata TaxID=271217 RepID=A0AAD8DPG1_MYTSE|nr:hypothetical protein PYW07_004931 [Mythimna separata]